MNLKHTKNMCIIYKLESPNNKVYIGQTINFIERYKKYKLNKNSIGKHISNAISFYGGIENFNIEFLSMFPKTDNLEKDKENLNKLEIYYIDKFNSIKEGYNLTGGGKGSYKRIITKETRKKLHLAGKKMPIISNLKLNCYFCKKIFELKPSVYKTRITRNLSNKVFCSLSCSSKFQHNTI